MNPSVGRRAYLAAVSAAGVGALAGCAELASFGDETTEGWTTFRGDPGNSGVRPAEAGPGSSLSRAWELRWADVLAELEGEDPDAVEPMYSEMDRERAAGISVEFSDPVLASDAVACSVGYRWYDPEDETEFERTGALAVERPSGDVRWSRPLGDARTTDADELDPSVRSADPLAWFGAEVVEETLLVPAPLDSGIGVVVLDAETGDRVDEFDLGLSPECGRPRVAGESLFAVDPSSEENRLRAFDVRSGTEEWSTPVAVGSTPYSPGLSSLSFGADLVWTVERPDGEPAIVARDPADGAERRRSSRSTRPTGRSDGGTGRRRSRPTTGKRAGSTAFRSPRTAPSSPRASARRTTTILSARAISSRWTRATDRSSGRSRSRRTSPSPSSPPRRSTFTPRSSGRYLSTASRSTASSAIRSCPTGAPPHSATGGCSSAGRER